MFGLQSGMFVDSDMRMPQHLQMLFFESLNILSPQFIPFTQLDIPLLSLVLTPQGRSLLD
jgi:hypothetical protein